MYNTNRVEDILIVMEDCVYKLDLFCNSDSYANSTDIAIKIFMEEGFRGYIRAFQEQLIKYLSHMSRGLYDRKDKLGYKDIIIKHKNANQLSNVSTEFLIELRKGRNYIAHGYEYPDFQVIYEFYKQYREEFDNVIESVKESIILSKQANSDNKRNNNEVDLYNTIEIARNLLDVLDDKTIADKTGLSIDFIKSLRI
ncbi:MAG: hypothetical protein ACRDD7_07115 [Peptostreptococcaceae bacterium]